MSKETSRRARRRMRAQLRDLQQHGTRDGVGKEYIPQSRPKAHAIMMPKPCRRAPASAPIKARTYTVLQEIFAGRPYGKRRIRYTTCTGFRGSKSIGPGPVVNDAMPRGVRIVTPKRDK